MFTVLENNSISLGVLRSPYTFGQQITIDFSGSDNPSKMINLYDTYFRFIINVTGRTTESESYVVIKNILAWFLAFDINIMYNQGKNYSNSALSNRGQIGNILQLFSNSFSKDIMVKELNLISNGVSRTESTFEVAVNLRYLFDIAQSSSWQSIKNININMTMDDVKNIFQFDPLSPTANANISQIYLETNVCKFEIPPELNFKQQLFFLPESSRIYTQSQRILVGDSSISLTITPPGRQIQLFYYFAFEGIKENTNDKTYSINGNDSYVKNHSISAMNGKIYPVQNNYQGLNRHYNDLLKNIQKFNPNASSAISYSQYVGNDRVYSINTNDSEFSYGSYSFFTETEKPFTKPCQIILFSIYYPTKKELLKIDYQNKNKNKKII
jgi:hypothetical protein